MLFDWVCFGIFWAFTKGYVGSLAVKPLVYLGSISYSLYLIHQNIGYVIIQNLEKYELATSVSIILIPFTINVMIASLMYNFIEKPTMKMIRKKWKDSRLGKQEAVAPVQV